MFSSYSQIRFALNGLISFDQAIEISYYLTNSTKIEHEYKEQYEQYFKWRSEWEDKLLTNWFNDWGSTVYSKDKLLLKISEHASNDERELLS